MNIQELIDYVRNCAEPGTISLFDEDDPQEFSITPDRRCLITHEMAWRYVLVSLQPEYEGTFPAVNAKDTFANLFGFGNTSTVTGAVLDSVPSYRIS